MTAHDELVLSGWSAVSGYGVGSAEFFDGVNSGRTSVVELDAQASTGPFDRAAMVPGFSVRGRLGRKGTRSMDRATGIAVTVIDQLLESCGPDAFEDWEEVGLVLGTGSGSVQSIMDFTRDSLTGEKPYHVDPAQFPNTVMNRAAGQSAIWHGIKGPNTTIAGGWLTGLLALSYAVRLHRGGHCSHVLWGAVEEYSEQRSWLEWHGRPANGSGAPLGEGGAVFLLESGAEAVRAGREPLASVLGTRFAAFDGPQDVRQTVAECVRGVLSRSKADSSDVFLVAPHGSDTELGGAERAGILDGLGTAADPGWVNCEQLLGDTSAASNSLQFAAVLARAAARESTGGRRLALVTGVDTGGMAGCALLSAAAR